MKTGTQHVLELLARFESRNVTYQDPEGGWPMVWARAKGNFVWDPEGRRYLDFTAAFGVAAAGHANPRVVRAGQRQMAKLLHAMGDVHPHPLKAQLAGELSRLTFERWHAHSRRAHRAPVGSTKARSGKTIFCNSGFEAVEAALKTALLATGKRGIVAFKGGYHGLGYGALNVTHRDYFRGPFRSQLREFGRFLPFPTSESELEKVSARLDALLEREKIGAVLVEPIQTRGGINVPPPAFLAVLRKACDRTGTLLILDEIYTGFGRTGRWFACEHAPVIPDIVCLGKALTGGFPLSACVGRADLMDAAWPASPGEAIHTSTFLGHPVGCAMALAQIEELERRRLPDRAAALGDGLLSRLGGIHPPEGLRLQARGKGLLVGLEVKDEAGRPAGATVIGWIKKLLERGYILLPEGDSSEVLAFTPPLTTTRTNLNEVVDVLDSLLALS